MNVKLVGEAGAMPGSNGGFTMACFNASDVPIGTKLYIELPQERMVGCEGVDGLIRAHKDSETCDVCAPVVAGHVHPHAKSSGCHCIQCRPLEKPCDCGGCRDLAQQPSVAPVEVEGLRQAIEILRKTEAALSRHFHNTCDGTEIKVALEARAFIAQQPAPSVPVGVEDGPIDASDNAEYIEHCADRLERCGLRVTAGALRVIAHEHRSLAQRPAAVG